MRGGRSGGSVVQPLHRQQIIPPTRCTPMMPQPSGDWNVFQQIFAEHWDGFTHAHPRYQTSSYDGLVAKMLACGNPEQMGYLASRCLHCGQGTHRVSMSCTSALLCFARKVCRFARKICRLASQRQKRHMERL